MTDRTAPRMLTGMAIVLAALMIVVALYCGSRLVLPHRHDPEHAYDVDVTHLVMATLMAAMLIDAVPRAAESVIVTFFCAAAVWFCLRGLRPRLRTTHLSLGVASLAMIYMLVPQAATADATSTVHPHVHGAPSGSLVMTGPAGPTLSLIGLGLLVAMIAVAVAGAIRVGEPGRSTPSRLSVGCEVTMAISMGYMLVSMV